jgi:hypothetical protein
VILKRFPRPQSSNLVSPRNAMYYRVYILNDEGHISRFRELDCADDEEAKHIAAQMLDGHDFELWQEKRLVAILRHNDKN